MTASLLRRAAAKLRETAAGTSPTPWQVRLFHNKKHPSMVSGARWITGAHETSISLKHPHNLADHQWQVLASPAIAEPLAAWLEATAARLERQALAVWHESVEPHAFTVARAILGEEAEQ